MSTRFPSLARLVVLVALFGAGLAAPRGATAQVGAAPVVTSDVRHVQAGVAVIPGLGLQGGYVSPRSFYTVEGLLYVDGSPPFAGGEGTLQLSGGIGAALRVLGLMRTMGTPGYVGRDLDVGIRFGPSLFFAIGESSREENPFSLFLDPFARFTSSFGADRYFFAELGVQRPILRAGLLFGL